MRAGKRGENIADKSQRERDLVIKLCDAMKNLQTPVKEREKAAAVSPSGSKSDGGCLIGGRERAALQAEHQRGAKPRRKKLNPDLWVSFPPDSRVS